MRSKIDPFRVRTEKIKRNRGKSAPKITKRYRVKSSLGGLDYNSVITATERYLREVEIDQNASLSVVTLFGYQPIKVHRLV